MDYEHTQRAPLYLLLHAIGIATVVGAWQIEDPEVSTPIAIFSGFFFLLGLSFRQLSCRDEGDYLRISFGPLPLFRRKLLYSGLEKVEASRSNWKDGWGIHLSSRGGWVWNIWGYDCVDIDSAEGKKLRLGTDDPEGLAAFLVSRVPGPTDQRPNSVSPEGDNHSQPE
ncbi:MAG: hypothetical protein VYB15_02890 [Planctomycetota bacterium]|nr:hypothetical protein [Planctomycetota bacterium]